MGFGFKTRNIHNDIQKKNPFVGVDIEPAQLAIYVCFGILGFYFIFSANIWFFWKIIAGILCFLLANNLASKYKRRTFFQWLRMYIRKISRGTLSVDRGVDLLYFKRKK